MSEAVLITGAGTRVGAHLAKGLAADGWAVVVHYNRSTSKAERVVAHIETSGGRAVPLKANLNIPADVKGLIERAANAIGTPLTALINNASTFDPDSAKDFSSAMFDHHMDTNLRAPLQLTQQLAVQLPQEKTGCVINMIDNRVMRPSSDYFTYALSKAGLHWATKTMAQTFAPRLRVNGLGPGPTLQNKAQIEAEFEAEQKATLTGAGSPPDTLLDAARYLLSASAVTGQMIAVDGGQHLYESKRT